MDEDISGLTFEEWDPSADTDASEAPVAMKKKGKNGSGFTPEKMKAFFGWNGLDGP